MTQMQPIPLQHMVTVFGAGTGERAVEALKEMDQQITPWFQTAAGELLKEMPAEKALALALAKITGNTELKVQPTYKLVLHGSDKGTTPPSSLCFL